MRISEWSSDVCSSDLDLGRVGLGLADQAVLVLLGAVDVVERGLDLFGRTRVGQVELGDQQAGAVGIERGLQHLPRRHRQRLAGAEHRSEEHTSELQSLMRISYAVFCLKKTRQPSDNIQLRPHSNY